MRMAESETKKPSYDDLYRENQALQQKLAALQAEEKAIWTILAGTNRRLQMSSAAIKAAVSSLLNYDILWDGANQHEFLETINTSIDQAGNLIRLFTLTFRLEAENLSLTKEPQVLQEILSAVQDHLAASLPNLIRRVTLPPEGKLIEVDFEYFMLALELMLEAINQMGIQQLGIQAVEEPGHWAVQIEGIDSRTLQKIQTTFEQPLEPDSMGKVMPLDNLLKFRIAYLILKLQEVSLSVSESSNRSPIFKLMIPILE